MKSLLVTDLGGTKCRVALLREDLTLLEEIERPTVQDHALFLKTLIADLSSLRDQASALGVQPPSAIGVGTAGVVLADRRTIHYAPNLPVGENVDFAACLESALDLPTVVINDGRASAIGEHVYGDAKGASPLLALFFGTGIGIGLVVNGEPYAGFGNAAGEVGHTLFRHGGLLCSCGRHGCFEAYCGGRPMTERASRELDGGPWTVDAIVARALDKNSVDAARAQAILDDAANAAGAMVGNLCTILNPEVVVLGGGVLKGWPELANRVEEHTRAWCAETVTQDLRFVPSRGGSDAILWGAAASTNAF